MYVCYYGCLTELTKEYHAMKEWWKKATLKTKLLVGFVVAVVILVTLSLIFGPDEAQALQTLL